MNVLPLNALRSLLLCLMLAAPAAWALDGDKPQLPKPVKAEAGKPELPQRWDRLERRATERVEQKARPRTPVFPAERY